MKISKRHFLTTFGLTTFGVSLLPLFFIKKISKDKPKLGYVNVDTIPEGPGKWELYADDINLSAKYRIYACNDIDNWYEKYYRTGVVNSSYDHETYKVYNSNIRLVYRGNNPKYKHFV